MSNYRSFGLAQWLQHIQRQHWRSVEMKLDRISEVWKRLDGDKTALVIAVAGTNGKGSCVAMMESILTTAGCQTGSYTSPHLLHYNERICINGAPVSDALLTDTFCQIEQARGNIGLTYFEYGTLCALRIFQQQGVQVSVLEAGMGGRLDAINMIDNDIALITCIGIDHQQWLGSDTESIGAEKAGIINTNARAVFAAADMPRSVGAIASVANAMLLQAGKDYQLVAAQNSNSRRQRYRWHTDHADIAADWHDINGLIAPLYGRHQAQNLGGVIACLGLTSDISGVTPAHLQPGLAATRLAARCQIIAEQPLIVLDVAHNADAAEQLSFFMQDHPVAGLTHAVLGVLQDKALMPLLSNIATGVDRWFLATLNGDRGQTAAQLQRKMLTHWSAAKTNLYDSPVAAYQAAVEAAEPADCVIIFGSFYTVSDILGILQR